jgi:F0F1-type ATP synthase membrane subunit a
MPKKVIPTGKDKSMLVLHTVIFAIVTVASWMFYDKPLTGHWAYPWPAWTTAAWALALLGHFCIVFVSYEDKGYQTYRQQQGYEK